MLHRKKDFWPFLGWTPKEESCPSQPPPPSKGAVKQGKSSKGSIDMTKTCLDPQRVRTCKGERPHWEPEGVDS